MRPRPGELALTPSRAWESAEAFGAFNEQRLAPAVQEIGIQGEPEVRFCPMHACFAPALGGSGTVRDL